MHTLERALDELVVLQRKIIKSEWIVLRNTQWLSKQKPISGTSTEGMKAEKRNTIVPLRKQMLNVEYYTDLASSYFLSAKTLILCTTRNQFQVLELGAAASFVMPMTAQGPARPAFL